MIDYEVGGELTLLDRISPTLRGILALTRELVPEFDRIKELSKDLFAGTGAVGLNRQLGKMDEVLATVRRSLEHTGGAGDTQFANITASVGKTEDAVKALKAELAEASAVAKTLRIPVVPAGAGGGHGGRGGTGGGHSGGGGRAVQRGMEGHYAPHVGMNISTGIMGAVGYGVYEQAKLVSETNAILLGTGQPMDSKYRSAIAAVIRKISSQTGLGYGEAGEAVKNTMLGFPNISMDERLKFAASRARYAMIEHLAKPDISWQEAEKASIGLTHMSGGYSEADMLRMQSDVAAITTLTPENLGRVERAASYAMPMARIAGVTPETIFGIVTANQITGTTNTKSGTWLASLITTGLNPKGGYAGLMSSRSGRVRAAMMRKLGLIDKHGHLVGMNMMQEGRPDLLQQILASHMAGIPKAQLPGDFEIAAGSTTGGRQLALMSQPNYANIAMLAIAKQHDFLQQGSKSALANYTKHDPTLQFNQTLMDLTNVLSDIGKVVLPPLTVVLKELDSTLKVLLKHPAATKAAGYGSLGLLAYAGARTLWRALGFGGKGTAGGAAAPGAASAAPAAPAPRPIPSSTGGWLSTLVKGVTESMVVGSTIKMLNEAPKGTYPAIDRLNEMAHRFDHPAVTQHLKAMEKFPSNAAMLPPPLHGASPLIAMGTFAHDAAQAIGTNAKAGIVAATPELAARIAAAVAAAVHAAVASITLHIDGAQIGKVVTEHQEHEATKPSAGPGGFDTGLSPLRPGFAFGGL